ncbi:MAG: CRTAC1 family protein [Gemmatimonadales bacterium]
MRPPPAASILIVALAGTLGDRQAVPSFVEVTDAAPTRDLAPSRGVTWADVDGDGDADLYVARSEGYRSMLYRNDGGRLVALTESPISVDVGNGEGASWVDLDGDGDLDFYAVNRSHRPALLYRNDGERLTRWPDSLLTAPRAASMACFVDVDRDGDLDGFVVGYDDSPSVLALNDGRGRFEPAALPASATEPGTARACAWGDLDDDGLPELFVANARRPNLLLRNLGDGRLAAWPTPHLDSHAAYSYGASWADTDQDGDLDLFVANFDGDNVLYRNDGGRLTPLSRDATPQSAASKGHTWGDFDLDGNLDLYLGSGTPAEGMLNRLHLGDGRGGFRIAPAAPWLLQADTSAGIAAADYDRDGDLDLYVANWGSARSPDRLYRAETVGRSWLALRLQGRRSNRFGIGARVAALATIGDERRWRHRYLRAATGYAGQDEPIVHFGLGDAAGVDSLVVRWPSGRVDRFGRLAGRLRWIVREGERAPIRER